MANICSDRTLFLPKSQEEAIKRVGQAKESFVALFRPFMGRKVGRSEEAGLDPLQTTCIPSPGLVLHSTIPFCSLISRGMVFYYWFAAGCSPSTSEAGIVTQAKLKSTQVRIEVGKTNCQELNPELLLLRSAWVT